MTYTGGIAYFVGYNYGTSAYTPLHLNGNPTVINIDSGGPVEIGTSSQTYANLVVWNSTPTNGASGIALGAHNAGGATSGGSNFAVDAETSRASFSGTNYGVYGGANGSSTNNWGVMCGYGSCGANTSWTITSDVRLKKDIADLSEERGLAAIMKLRPVTFHWKDVKKDQRLGQRLGFIAQDVEKVFPELVDVSKSDVTVDRGGGKTEVVKDAKSLAYADVVVPLVKAVQELKADNDNLHAANDNEAAQIKALTTRLDALESAHR